MLLIFKVVTISSSSDVLFRIPMQNKHGAAWLKLDGLGKGLEARQVGLLLPWRLAASVPLHGAHSTGGPQFEHHFEDLELFGTNSDAANTHHSPRGSTLQLPRTLDLPLSILGQSSLGCPPLKEGTVRPPPSVRPSCRPGTV